MRYIFIILLISTSLSAEMRVVQCSLESPKCVPPTTFKNTNRADPVAFNVLVRFGGEASPACCKSIKYWSWIKVENSPLCSLATRNLFGKMCDVKIGEVFYTTPPFRICDPVIDRTCR